MPPDRQRADQQQDEQDEENRFASTPPVVLNAKRPGAALFLGDMSSAPAGLTETNQALLAGPISMARFLSEVREGSDGRDTKMVVLVVEDELFVRLMAIDAIEDAGYGAVGVEIGEEALTLLASRPDIGLLFTDIKMLGQVDGLEVAARVRARWPALPILLTSGHLYQGDERVPSAIPFPKKPHRAGALIAEIGRLSG